MTGMLLPVFCRTTLSKAVITAMNLLTATGAVELYGTWGWVRKLDFTAVTGLCGTGDCDSQSDYGIKLITVAVPEPESYAMLLAGLLAVGWIVRRRQRVRKTVQHSVSKARSRGPSLFRARLS